MSTRVAFVLYEYPLGVSLMVLNSIRLLLDQGRAVDVFINARNLETSPMAFVSPRLTVTVYEDYPPRPWFWRVPRALARRLRPWLQAVRPPRLEAGENGLRRLDPDLAGFARWLQGRLDNAQYAYLFAVECKSLIALSFITTPEKVVYYNMELLEGRAGHPLYPWQHPALLKQWERAMIRRLSHVVVQSPERARLFSRLNDVDEQRIHLLPVASLGPPQRHRTDHWQRRFSIPAGHRVVIYAGNVAAWAQLLDIVRSVPAWPPRFALIIHTWNAAGLRSRYGQRLRKAARGLPVYFSSDYLSPETLSAALASADLGLMCYEPIDDNFTEILFSSNKLSEYLRCGLPVICSDFPSLGRFVRQHRIGVPISAPADLPAALARCAADLPTWRDNAWRCYEQFFRFEPPFEALCRRLGLDAVSVGVA